MLFLITAKNGMITQLPYCAKTENTAHLRFDAHSPAAHDSISVQVATPLNDLVALGQADCHRAIGGQ